MWKTVMNGFLAYRRRFSQCLRLWLSPCEWQWLQRRIRSVTDPQSINDWGSTGLLSLAALIITALIPVLYTLPNNPRTLPGSIPFRNEFTLWRGSILAGMTAGAVAVTQLGTTFKVPPLIRRGAKRWTLGYAMACCFIASLTFVLFRETDMLESAGQAAPLLVGFFYPGVLFRLLGTATTSQGNDQSGELQQIHGGFVSLFVGGIRRNSLRHWAYVSEVLATLPLWRLLELLVQVLASPASMNDQRERERLFRHAVNRLDDEVRGMDTGGMRTTTDKMSTVSGGLESRAGSGLESTSDSTQTATGSDSKGAGDASTSGSQNLGTGTSDGDVRNVDHVNSGGDRSREWNHGEPSSAARRWSPEVEKWRWIEKLYLVGNPELILDQVEPDVEANWILSRMTRSDLLHVLDCWIGRDVLSDFDRQVVSRIERGEPLNSERLNLALSDQEALKKLMEIILRYATRELYQNVICEFRQAEIRCLLHPRRCWIRFRSQCRCSRCADGTG